jgi:hypothetical protein
MHERKIVLTPAFVTRFLRKQKPAVAGPVAPAFAPVVAGMRDIKAPLVRA